MSSPTAPTLLDDEEISSAPPINPPTLVPCYWSSMEYNNVPELCTTTRWRGEGDEEKNEDGQGSGLTTERADRRTAEGTMFGDNNDGG
ncbi:hypothetical protein Droror1_Dr00018466 [Drosera rotundifolia]